MFGLGKPRSSFGKWLDKQGLTQNEVADASGVSRSTLTNLCGDKDYAPKYSTFAKVQRGIDKLGYDIEYDDFW